MSVDIPASGGFTIPNVRRDFPEWHRGRPHYALWALDVDYPPVRQRVHAARRHLDGLLLGGYCRQPHVTLSVCGFPSDAPRHADDFGSESLRMQLAALDRARPGPFEIGIGTLDTFASAPYLTVHDEGGYIAALRACLALSGLDRSGAGDAAHVTVGLYAQVLPMSAVQARLASFQSGEVLRLHVAGMSLMSYAAQNIGGSLTRIADYDFGSGVLRHAD